MAPQVGDQVQFVNGGQVIPAGVLKVHDDGTLDITYHGGVDHPAPVVARSIPACPNGGSFGWQLLVAAVAAEASPAEEQAAEIPAEILIDPATESPPEA